MNALTALKVSKHYEAKRKANFGEPERISMSRATGTGVVLALKPLLDYQNRNVHFKNYEIPEVALRYDDWEAVDPIEPIQALAKVVE